MSLTLLATLEITAAEFAGLDASVFQLDDPRLETGHSVGVTFSVQKAGLAAKKIGSSKSSKFRGKPADRAASVAEREAKTESARFVRKPESQMKRKASATHSPFDRGLLLGRRAFLF
jgi:hypothetical protein